MSYGHTSVGYNKQCILGGFSVDPMPNSPNSHHRNCIADRKENYQWDLGMKGQRRVVYL